MPIDPPPAIDGYSRRGLLGEIVRFAWMKFSGTPFVNGFHVVPPSVDLKIPPPGPLHAEFSHGPCRASHNAAYTICGFVGSICPSDAPVFSSFPRTFSN